MSKPQWQIDMEKAADAAAKTADEVTASEFEDLSNETAQLQGIFDELKLTDEATYNQLIEIVNEATRKNEAIGSVIERVKSLGAAGKGLLETIGNLSSGGGLAALRTALKL